MRIILGLAALAALGATAASAQPGHLTDQAYLQAARCVGLASSKTMGVSDSKPMKSWLETESVGRQPYILEKGDQMQSDAKRQADRARSSARSRLQSELSGQCATLKG